MTDLSKISPANSGAFLLPLNCRVNYCQPMFRPLLNRAEFYHQPDDDLPSWPSPLDDLASPQARRLEKLIETAREKQQEKPQ